MNIDASKRSIYIDPERLSWQPSTFDGIEHKILWSDSETGRSTILFKLAPGAVVPAHEHMDVEQTWIVSGTFEDYEGKALPGHYILEAGRQPARGTQRGWRSYFGFLP